MTSQNDAIVTITDLETLKIISDPLRLNIIQIIKNENLNGALCSVKQISEQLDIPPAKLYYHVKLLEKHGLLQVAETRIVSGIIEKLYSVRAYQIQVSNDLFLLQEGGDSIAAVFTNLLNKAIADIRQILQKNKGETIQQQISVANYNIKLTTTELDEFQNKLDDLLKKYSTAKKQTSQEPADNYNFIYAAYPLDMKKSQTEQ